MSKTITEYFEHGELIMRVIEEFDEEQDSYYVASEPPQFNQYISRGAPGTLMNIRG